MQFKVLTYNIHRAIGLDRRYQPKRITKILKEIDADIVLLQEVDSGVPRSQLMDMAKVLSEETDYPYYELGLNVHLPKGHYGNATFSKYPIKSSQNIDITIDNKKARGCLYTKISIADSVKNQQLHVFNWHLGLSAKERRKQCALLLQSPTFKKISKDELCLVAGDFNDWRSLLRILFVEGREFLCATDHHTKRGEVAIKTYPSFSPRGGLDRIYYRGGMKCVDAKKYQKQIAKVASDHLPVYATFEI